MIADLIEWDGPRHRLLIYALLHDVDETVTGEMCWPIKTNVVDKTKFVEYVAMRTAEMVPQVMVLHGKAFRGDSMDDEIQTIAKAADLLDAALYCASEVAFGNAAMARRLPKCVEKLKEAWFRLPCENSALVAKLWHQKVVESIHAHQSGGNYDFER